MTIINFLTFANTNFMNSNRIVEEARSFNIFNNIIELNETHIPDFINKHIEFINNNPSGYGNFIWKPKIIFDTLLKMNENDILIYCDSGFYLNKNGIERLNFYFDKLNDNDMVVFSTNDLYKVKYYVKMDAIMNYYPEFNHNNHNNENACYAGLMILKKTNNVINLISDWLNLCENYNFINIAISINYNEAEYFRGNDKDNGLFNLCLLKYNNFYKIYPDEINLYDNNGNQLHHTNIDFNTINWELLNDKPFHCRRLTPRFFPKLNL
jgi:hypothetical protein